MRYEFKASFDRSVKLLPSQDKEEIKALCLIFINLLEEQRELAKGIGLKKLKDDYWEIRTGLKPRILFRWNEDTIQFMLAGGHGQVRRFLKTV